jgi:hypothetical protein
MLEDQQAGAMEVDGDVAGGVAVAQAAGHDPNGQTDREGDPDRRRPSAPDRDAERGQTDQAEQQQQPELEWHGEQSVG